MSVPPWGSPAALYALDCSVAELCRDMQVCGFAFDTERAREFAAHLEGAEAAARMRLNEVAGRKVAALSVKDLGRLFFDELRAPIFYRSQLTGRPSLGVESMRGYAACGRDELAAAALAVLDVRRLRKVRSTYVVRGCALCDDSADGRIHPSWQNYGTVSGRWSCQGPNLANLPRAANDPVAQLGGIRSLYVAPPGCLLVSFDYSQLEMRMAAYASGDPAMIAACQASDLHAANATIIFGEAFTGADAAQRDKLRNIAKSSGFAVCYMAGADTVFTRIVATGVPITLRAVEAMLAKLRRGFPRYYEWQEERLRDCVREGYVREPVTGRRRWLGHDPQPPEAANYPIQGGAAGLLNTRLPMLAKALTAECARAKLVASVYDSGTFEVPEAFAPRAAELCAEIMQAPLTIGSSGQALSASFPVEVKITPRWK